MGSVQFTIFNYFYANVYKKSQGVFFVFTIIYLQTKVSQHICFTQVTDEEF